MWLVGEVEPDLHYLLVMYTLIGEDSASKKEGRKQMHRARVKGRCCSAKLEKSPIAIQKRVGIGGFVVYILGFVAWAHR